MKLTPSTHSLFTRLCLLVVANTRSEVLLVKALCAALQPDVPEWIRVRLLRALLPVQLHTLPLERVFGHIPSSLPAPDLLLAIVRLDGTIEVLVVIEAKHLGSPPQANLAERGEVEDDVNVWQWQGRRWQHQTRCYYRNITKILAREGMTASTSIEFVYLTPDAREAPGGDEAGTWLPVSWQPTLQTAIDICAETDSDGKTWAGPILQQYFAQKGRHPFRCTAASGRSRSYRELDSAAGRVWRRVVLCSMSHVDLTAYAAIVDGVWLIQTPDGSKVDLAENAAWREMFESSNEQLAELACRVDDCAAQGVRAIVCRHIDIFGNRWDDIEPQSGGRSGSL